MNTENVFCFCATAVICFCIACFSSCDKERNKEIQITERIKFSNTKPCK